MLIVADTSALLSLAACDGLKILDALYKQVRVPRAVFEECVVLAKPHAEQLRQYLQDKISEVERDQFVVAAAGLGKGELEAMALYKRLEADRLLVDDGRARRIAKLNHIEVVGSIGVLLLAKSRGLVTSLRSRLESIQSAGIYISEALVNEALRLADET